MWVYNMHTFVMIKCSVSLFLEFQNDYSDKKNGKNDDKQYSRCRARPNYIRVYICTYSKHGQKVKQNGEMCVLSCKQIKGQCTMVMYTAGKVE